MFAGLFGGWRGGAQFVRLPLGARFVRALSLHSGSLSPSWLRSPS